jgi:hypothetical protein
MNRALLITIIALILSTVGASAHSQSYGYLTVNISKTTITGMFELAIRDADRVHSLDSNNDGTITWGDIRQSETTIAHQLLSTLTFGDGEKICTLNPSPLMINTHGGETYLVAPFSAPCAGAITLTYNAMFTIDAQHRGLVTANMGNQSQTFVMSPDAKTASLGQTAGAHFTSFAVHGVQHLLAGYDHMLFLITLLLATVARNHMAGLRTGLIEATKVVTAFTVSHSCTLALAALGWITIPVPLTESLIAITIALAAFNNLWPVVRDRIWLLALGFGLIHGLGFANVLTDLGLNTGNLLQALLAFNLGVEAGQLAVVLVALPLMYLIMRSPKASRTLPLTNLAIAIFGLAWFSDRAFGTSLMPF